MTTIFVFICMMNPTPVTVLLIVLVICGLGMTTVRILKRRRTGPVVFFLEALYLCFYAFLGGSLFFYLTQESKLKTDILWVIAFLVFYWGGFTIRAYGLYRQMGLASSADKS